MSTIVSFEPDPSASEAHADDKWRPCFSEASIRAAFVRKVFATVSLMLGTVALMTAVPFMHPPFMKFVRENAWLYWCSYALFLVVYFTLMCFHEVRRTYPANVICTAVLTLTAGYLTMMITAYHDFVSVLLALLVTTLCCTAIIVFAVQIKYDLTSLIGIMFLAGFGLLVFGIVAVIALVAFGIYWLYLIYAFVAAVFFMIFLAIDVQMVMGGRRYEIRLLIRSPLYSASIMVLAPRNTSTLQCSCSSTFSSSSGCCSQ